MSRTAEILAETIRQQRIDQNMSQVELSKRINEYGVCIPSNGITKIESGTRELKADELIAIANVLGINIAQWTPESSITTGDGKPPRNEKPRMMLVNGEYFYNKPYIAQAITTNTVRAMTAAVEELSNIKI